MFNWVPKVKPDVATINRVFHYKGCTIELRTNPFLTDEGQNFMATVSEDTAAYYYAGPPSLYSDDLTSLLTDSKRLIDGWVKQKETHTARKSALEHQLMNWSTKDV